MFGRHAEDGAPAASGGVAECCEVLDLAGRNSATTPETYCTPGGGAWGEPPRGGSAADGGLADVGSRAAFMLVGRGPEARAYCDSGR